METSPLPDPPLRPRRARVGLLRWLATLVLLLGLGGPLSSLGGGEAVASSSEAHAEVVSSPMPGSVTRVQRIRRAAATTPTTPMSTATAVDRTVAGRAGEPWPAAGVATLPDPRGPPLRLG